jgi:hypothetical protein
MRNQTIVAITQSSIHPSHLQPELPEQLSQEVIKF